MEFFDYIKNLYTKDIELTSTSQHANMWMVNRFASGSPVSFELAQELNLRLSRIPDWVAGMYLYRAILKQMNAPWLKYNKKKALPYPEELISKISEAFCCNTLTAVQYIALLEKEGEDPYKFFGLKRKSNGKKNQKAKSAGPKNSKGKKDERISRSKKSRRKTH